METSASEDATSPCKRYAKKGYRCYIMGNSSLKIYTTYIKDSRSPCKFPTSNEEI